MLTRQQVLIEDWLVEYLKLISERYDLSFSEVIRIGLCAQFTKMISLLYPGRKFDIDEKDFLDLLLKANADKKRREELHKYISKVYFEARKAVEYRMAQEKSGKRR
jgi:hypothetical protein